MTMHRHSLGEMLGLSWVSLLMILTTTPQMPQNPLTWNSETTVHLLSLSFAWRRMMGANWLYGSHICPNNILTMTVLFVKGTSSTSTPTKPTRPAVTSTKTVTGQLPSVSEPVQPTVVPTELVRPWDCHPPVAGLTQNYLSYDTLNTSCPSHSLVRPTLCWSYWMATSHKSLELI